VPISERDSTTNSEGSLRLVSIRKGRLDKYRRQERDGGCNFSTNKRPGHPRGDTVHNLICTSETKRHHPLSFFPLSLLYSPSPPFLARYLLSPLSSSLSSSFDTLCTPLTNIPLYYTMLPPTGVYAGVSGRRDTSTTNKRTNCLWLTKQSTPWTPPRETIQEGLSRFRNTLLDVRYPQCQFSSVCRNDVIIRMSLRCKDKHPLCITD